MVKEIKCYQDSTGKIHQSACEAHRAELIVWLMQGDAINDASAKALADRMIEESRDLKKLIEAVDAHCPRAECAAEPLVMAA